MVIRLNKIKIPVLILLFILCSLFVSGCATYQNKVQKSRELINQFKTDEALKELEKLASQESSDQLIYLLDYATVLQLAGQLKESNQVFLKAKKLVDEMDYHSISKLAGSMLINEEVVQYKGDTFEKIFIHAYLALNFLELNNLDDALVEARKINEEYLKYRYDDKKNFELNVFAKYLSAVIWELDEKYDDAFIAYNEAYKLDPNISMIKGDLIRTAKRSNRTEEYKKLKSEFNDVYEDPSWYDKKNAQILVFYQQGWGPRKTFNPQNIKWPTLKPVYSELSSSELKLVPKADLKINLPVDKFTTKIIYDVEKAAIETLEDDRASLIARRIGAFAAKEVMADQIRQKNEALGLIAWIFFHASERADLRQWSTLPQTIQLIRAYVPKGEYDLEIYGVGSFRNEQPNEIKEIKSLKLKSGEKRVFNFRTIK